jgi:hypothetical protein
MHCQTIGAGFGLENYHPVQEQNKYQKASAYALNPIQANRPEQQWDFGETNDGRAEIPEER